MFIDKDAEIKVEVFVLEKVDGSFSAWSSETKPEKLQDGIQKYEIFFRMPTYKDNLIFLDAGVKFDEKGQLSFVTNQSRFTRFVTLLKRWTFKDSDGNDIPATSENAEKLVAPIVSVIISELEKSLNL